MGGLHGVALEDVIPGDQRLGPCALDPFLEQRGGKQPFGQMTRPELRHEGAPQEQIPCQRVLTAQRHRSDVGFDGAPCRAHFVVSRRHRSTREFVEIDEGTGLRGQSTATSSAVFDEKAKRSRKVGFVKQPGGSESVSRGIEPDLIRRPNGAARSCWPPPPVWIEPVDDGEKLVCQGPGRETRSLQTPHAVQQCLIAP